MRSRHGRRPPNLLRGLGEEWGRPAVAGGLRRARLVIRDRRDWMGGAGFAGTTWTFSVVLEILYRVPVLSAITVSHEPIQHRRLLVARVGVGQVGDLPVGDGGTGGG